MIFLLGISYLIPLVFIYLLILKGAHNIWSIVSAIHSPSPNRLFPWLILRILISMSTLYYQDWKITKIWSWVLRYSMIEEKQTFDTNCFITETWTSTCAKTLTFCLVKTWFVLDLWFHCFCFSLLHSYIWLPRLFINFDAYLCYGLKDFCSPEFKCWNLGHKMISGSGGGLWEMMRTQGQSTREWNSKPWKQSQQKLPEPSTMWNYSEKKALQKQGPYRVLLQLWFCSSSFQNCEKWMFIV